MKTLRACCVCHTVYGCYKAEQTNQCRYCQENPCPEKETYEKKPEVRKVLETSHGFCKACFDKRMGELEPGRSNRLLSVEDSSEQLLLLGR